MKEKFRKILVGTVLIGFFRCFSPLKQREFWQHVMPQKFRATKFKIDAAEFKLDAAEFFGHAQHGFRLAECYSRNAGKYFKLAGKFFQFGLRRHIYKACKKARGRWFFRCLTLFKRCLTLFK